jgi:hypothetical protein
VRQTKARKEEDDAHRPNISTEANHPHSMDLDMGRVLISGGSPSSFFCFSLSFFFAFFFSVLGTWVFYNPFPHLTASSPILSSWAIRVRSFPPLIAVGGVRDARLAVPHHKVVEFSFLVILPFTFFFFASAFYPLSSISFFGGYYLKNFLNGALSSSSVKRKIGKEVQRSAWILVFR